MSEFRAPWETSPFPCGPTFSSRRRGHHGGICYKALPMRSMEELMRSKKRLLAVPVLTILAVGASQAQITSNPIPEPIVKKGIAVEIMDLVRLPDTRGLHGTDD